MADNATRATAQEKCKENALHITGRFFTSPKILTLVFKPSDKPAN
jgi:hypothetical protein